MFLQNFGETRKPFHYVDHIKPLHRLIVCDASANQIAAFALVY
jgi:hypothetical protein